MNQEDYPSDSDASDEDFRPDKEEADTGSELESNDEEPEDSSEQAVEKSSGSTGGRKRKRKYNTDGGNRSNGANKRTKAQDRAQQSDEEKDDELDEEEEKRRTDALWADFLGSGSSNSNIEQSNNSTSVRNSKTKVEGKKVVTETKSVSTMPKVIAKEKPTVAQLFEFAGEQIVLTKDDNSSISANTKDEKATSLPTVSKTLALKNAAPRGGSGLGSVLDQITKKNKLSTLEKTKLDWTSFKRQEGIEEELQTHNKGKDGFLERRDFLERTDLRQFEIEKSFRQTKRSNR
ncbi:craniofacial development protein 1 [Anopheles marshallii]|uniref:craniofacial development protein 1 n=1 Tax=Anopheles marshallii TaxID=1521116 RepID=UPI00237AD640|nr:craniofacial development protein 1 [Anopheles marshallii]